MRYSLYVLISIFFIKSLSAQKQVLSYSFEFEKSFLQKSDYDSYFLEDNTAPGFAFVLNDNKKAEYVLVDKNFKVKSKIQVAIDKTVFEISEDYLGGTATNGVFNFVYKVNDKKAFAKDKIFCQLEIVNFNTGTISNKRAFEIPKEEKLLTSFSDNNRYFTISCNDKASEIKLYMISPEGEPIVKVIPFTVPAGKDKDRKNISGYLKNIKLVKYNEEPELSSVVQPAKLFSAANSLKLVINDGDDPTHIFTINLPDFSTNEKFIEHSELIDKGKTKAYINSFLYDSILFSIVLNKKDIRIGVYNTFNGALLKSHEINEDMNFGLFAQTPVFEQRYGKKVTEKDVDDIPKLIKALSKGTEGITVYKNKTGQYILTIGSYDLIPVSSGGSSSMSSGYWTGGGMAKNYAGTPTFQSSTYVWNYRPGAPYYTTTDAKHYKTTFFKMLLDPGSYKPAPGKMPASVNAQIKNYTDETDNKAKATNQFALVNGQYYGYYDKESTNYIIEQIIIAK